MVILAIDDEKIILEDLEYTLKSINDTFEVITAYSAQQAMEIVRNKALDLVITDIQMPEVDGLTLAEFIKKKQPKCRVIILTAYEEYALEAWKLYLDGYLLKPVIKSQLISVMEHIGLNSHPTQKNLRAVCFGEFKLYTHDKQINFGRSKSEELMAILINECGRYVSVSEICDILWGNSIEDKKKKTYCRQLIHNIRMTLREYSAEDVLMHKRSYYAIDPQKVDCDYFELLKNNPDDSAYIGEFMSQYSWAKASAHLKHLDSDDTNFK